MQTKTNTPLKHTYGTKCRTRVKKDGQQGLKICVTLETSSLLPEILSIKLVFGTLWPQRQNVESQHMGSYGNY